MAWKDDNVKSVIEKRVNIYMDVFTLTLTLSFAIEPHNNFI